MCIYETIVCTECQRSEQLQTPCHMSYALVPSNMASHACEIREIPIAGLCTQCEYLRTAVLELNLGDKPEYPELSFEQFDQETLPENAYEMDEACNEEHSEQAELPFGTFDEEPSEEEEMSASLSSVDLSN